MKILKTWIIWMELSVHYLQAHVWSGSDASSNISNSEGQDGTVQLMSRCRSATTLDGKANRVDLPQNSQELNCKRIG